VWGGGRRGGVRVRAVYRRTLSLSLSLSLGIPFNFPPFLFSPFPLSSSPSLFSFSFFPSPSSLLLSSPPLLLSLLSPLFSPPSPSSLLPLLLLPPLLLLHTFLFLNCAIFRTFNKKSENSNFTFLSPLPPPPPLLLLSSPRHTYLRPLRTAISARAALHNFFGVLVCS